MAQAKLNHQSIYNLKMLKAAVIFAVCFIIQLFFSYSAFAAAPTASISTNKDNVGITITPSAEGTLGTNPEPTTVSYDTTCKVSGTKATIYISTSPRSDIDSDDLGITNGTALLGAGTAEGYNIPASATTTTDLTANPVAAALAKDTWGFNLDGGDTYFGFPSTNDPKIKLDVLDNSSSTKNDSGITVVYGSKIIYYNANVSTATPPGDYSATVTYTILPNEVCKSYIVNYDGNGADAGTSTASSTLYWSDKDGQTLASNNFTRDGYLFQGWALDKDAEEPDFCVSETDACPDGKQSYSDDKINEKGEAEVTVYAVWKLDKKYYLQDAETYAACMALDYGKTMKAYDNRDENGYLIGRLKDGTEKGKCWMLQNLRLIPTTTNVTSDNSNKTTASWSTAPAKGMTSTYAAPYYYSPTGTAKKYTGPSTGTVANITTYWTDISHTSDDIADIDSDIGLLYNYCAASAGEICGSISSSSSGIDATQDICPKGWRLPTGGSIDTNTTPNKGEFQTLYNAYGSVAAFDYAFKPVLAGRFTGSLGLVGSDGYYWSSSVSNTSGRYGLRVDTSGVGPANNYTRGYGFSVRCVAQTPPRTDLALTISFDGSMVEKVEVKKDSAEGNTVATISTGGGSTGAILTEKQAYYLVPTYRDGYEFDSWANGTGAAGTFSDPSNPMPAYTIGDGTNSVTLTAKQSCTSGTIATTTMQAFDPSVYADYCVGTTGTLTDSRNSESYEVVKINNTDYWMTENLRLAAGTVLNSSTSNVSDTFTLPTETWTSSTNYFCKPIMATAEITLNDTKTTEYYYNWYAATANPTSCSSPTSSSNATEANDSKSLGDICPKDWRLPRRKDKDGNAVEVDDSTWRTAVKNYGNLDYTGLFSSGTTGNVGSYGYWWTSTRYTDSNAHNLYYNSGTAGGSNGGKYFGRPVRCMRTS